MSDEGQVDDLENIPTGIPIGRVRAAAEALGLPAGSRMSVVDPHQVPLMVIVTDGGGKWRVQAQGTMRRDEAVRVLRSLADQWDLEDMGVSGD